MNSNFVSHNYLLLAILVIQVTGFGILWSKNSAPETIFVPTGIPDAAGKHTGQSMPITAIKLPDADALRASVRSVLQDELRAYVRQANGVPDPQAAEAARISRDPRGNAEAVAQSSGVVDQAIGKRSWTKEDSFALLPNLGKMSEAQRQELREKLYSAINRQELHLTEPPPL